MTGLLPPEQALATARCASCPKMCRSDCPTLAVTGNERHQPWGHAQAYRRAEGVDGGWADAGVVDSAYACATCGACTVPCRVDGVETPELTWAARAAVHRAGATPAVGLQAVEQARAGRVPAAGAGPGWVDPQPVLDALRTLATPGADLLLLPGCGALGRRPRAVLAAGRALRRGGIAFDVPAEHRCCGMPGLTFGDTTALEAMLDGALEQIAASGVRRVAVQSPSCAFLLGVRAPRSGRTPAVEVVPLAEVLGHIGADPATPPLGPVAVHDACHLARHRDATAAVRAVLERAGSVVVELARRGRFTQCSGQGGGLPLTHPEIAAGYLGLLAAEVRASGQATVVTGCASCATALEGALPDLRVLELAEAVIEMTGDGTDEPPPPAAGETGGMV